MTDNNLKGRGETGWGGVEEGGAEKPFSNLICAMTAQIVKLGNEFAENPY